MDNIGLQLYSLRHFTRRDFRAAVEMAAQLGYGAVEFAGYFGENPEDLAAFLKQSGLKAAGTHVPMEALTQDLDGVLSYAKKAGIPYIVCPALPQPWHESRQAWLKTSQAFESIGRSAARHGIGFAYHTHGYCFDEFDGDFGIDILFANTSPQYVKLQLDVGNTEMTGRMDSLAFIQKHAARMELLHLKDYKGVGVEEAVPVGDGKAPWPAIIALCRELNVKWYVVEYEGEEDTVMDALARSVKYAKGL